MLHPHPTLARMLRAHPQRLAQLYDQLTQITGHELRGEGRIYGGGLNKIEPSELGRISAAAIVHRWPELLPASRRTRTADLFPT